MAFNPQSNLKKPMMTPAMNPAPGGVTTQVSPAGSGTAPVSVGGLGSAPMKMNPPALGLPPGGLPPPGGPSGGMPISPNAPMGAQTPTPMKKGGKAKAKAPVKKMAKGGSASSRADGIATKGKTRGRYI